MKSATASQEAIVSQDNSDESNFDAYNICISSIILHSPCTAYFRFLVTPTSTCPVYLSFDSLVGHGS
jgi:hypothetical protein